MWLDYFRRIDVFEKEKTGPLLLALVIGGITPFLSLQVYRLIDELGLHENGEWLNDLFYSVFCIGLNEEVCKLTGVLLVFQILKKEINEPVDYLVYAGVTALGFSMVENYRYFENHGVRIITSRAFYSALEHIINTTLIIYGFYRYQMFRRGNPILNATVALALAVASHGLFDFFLSQSIAGTLTAFISLIIYLVGINFWVQMLNNANNYSAYFNYDKVPLSSRLVLRLLLWYGLTLLVGFINNSMQAGARFAVITLASGIASDGFLFFVVILRVSRFRILKSRYERLRLALPFYVTKNQDPDFILPFARLPFKIRGENHREHMLTRYLKREVILEPVLPAEGLLKQPAKVLVQNKYFLRDDVVVYTINLKLPADPARRRYMLRPRTALLSRPNVVEQVFGLYYFDLQDEPDALSEARYSNLVFAGWVTVGPEEFVQT